MALEEATRRAVERATKEGYLRATMKHPLTGFDPGNNIGMNIPDFTYQFVPGDSIEVTYVAKGGGSECFGGTRHRVVAFADGVKGIEKFVIDCFAAASRAGAICPPSVLGVGCMGAGGDTSVFAVNVEYAYTHIAGICVAISSNCMVARRASSRILADGTVERMTSPDWFGGR